MYQLFINQSFTIQYSYQIQKPPKKGVLQAMSITDEHQELLEGQNNDILAVL